MLLSIVEKILQNLPPDHAHVKHLALKKAAGFRGK
jgi:hypothetical protein